MRATARLRTELESVTTDGLNAPSRCHVNSLVSSIAPTPAQTHHNLSAELLTYARRTPAAAVQSSAMPIRVLNLPPCPPTFSARPNASTLFSEVHGYRRTQNESAVRECRHAFQWCTCRRRAAGKPSTTTRTQLQEWAISARAYALQHVPKGPMRSQK